MVKVCMIVNKQYRHDPRVRRYADSLADAGAKVDILCLRGQGQQSGEIRPGVNVYPIPLGRTGESIGRYLLQYTTALLLFTIWLLALHIKNHYHVVHVHNMPDFLVFAALIPRLLGTCVILDIHDPMPDFYSTKFKKSHGSALELAMMRAEEKVSIMVAQSVITVNTRAKANLVKRGTPADKITIIRNLPNPAIFNRDAYQNERNNNEGHFTLIFPGTIAPRYGLDVAIRALPLIRTQIPQLQLKIIGPKSDHTDELSEITRKLGVSDIVHFEPLIAQEEVPRQLARAEVGIYPAILDSYMDMATPTKVLEYAAMGIPIIASRVQALEQLFPDSTLLFFEAGNEHDFANCVLKLYRNSDLRDQLVKNMDDILKQTYRWNEERLTYLELLNRLLCLKGEDRFTTSMPY